VRRPLPNQNAADFGRRLTIRTVFPAKRARTADYAPAGY
jgi:hypothetical protein